MKDTESFDFDEVGSTTGERYVGKFVVKTLLTARDQLRADAFKRKELGERPQEADPTLKIWTGWAAELFVRVVEAPQWFYDKEYGLELQDYEIVNKLFDKVREVEKRFRDEIHQEAEEARKDMKSKSRRQKND